MKINFFSHRLHFVVESLSTHSRSLMIQLTGMSIYKYILQSASIATDLSMDNFVDYITSFSELSIGDIKMFAVLLT